MLLILLFQMQKSRDVIFIRAKVWSKKSTVLDWKLSLSQSLKSVELKLKSLGALAFIPIKLDQFLIYFQTLCQMKASSMNFWTTSSIHTLKVLLEEIHSFLSEYGITMKSFLKSFQKQPTIVKDFTMHWTPIFSVAIKVSASYWMGLKEILLVTNKLSKKKPE